MVDISVLTVPIPENIRREIILGNISNAENLIKKYLEFSKDALVRERLHIELERLKRMDKSFPLKRKDLLKSLKNTIKDFDNTELEYLIKNGYVDRIFLNGEERFMEKSIENIFFLNPEMKKRKIEPKIEKKDLLDSRIKKIMEGEILRYKITAGIELSVDKEAPYHVWLPIPIENDIISNVKILKTYPEKFKKSENSMQATVNFYDTEKRFMVEFSYEITETRISRREGIFETRDFVDEKFPHVVFTNHLKTLTEKIIEGEVSNYKKALKIYKWITENVYYSYVPPYIFFDNISEFAATNLKGDCGFMAMLFITMCRIAGIPAKWQSGWYITPEKVTPHDWAQVYLEGYGFVPVDASFGNVLKGNARYRDFYFGNMDGFRMVSSEDFQSTFDPEKKFIRSDPVDNQVGEIETESENIFDFRSKMYVKSFERVQ